MCSAKWEVVQTRGFSVSQRRKNYLQANPYSYGKLNDCYIYKKTHIKVYACLFVFPTKNLIISCELNLFFVWDLELLLSWVPWQHII